MAKQLPVQRVEQLTYFEPQRYPEAIIIEDGSEDGIVLTGPFCKNCGRREIVHLNDQPIRKHGTTKVTRADNVCPPPGELPLR